MMRMLVTNVGGVPGVVRTVVVGLCVVVGVVMGEPVYRRREHEDQNIYIPARHNKNIVRNDKDAAFILSKYGYLTCRIERRRQDADRQEGGSGHHVNLQAEAGAGRGDNLHPSADNPWAGNFLLSEEGRTRMCNDSEVEQAIRKYQNTYNLAPTGVLDQETKQMMSALRCGNDDTKYAVMQASERDSSPSGTTDHPRSAATTSGDDGPDNVQTSSSLSSSTLESTLASSTRSSSDPIAVNGVGDAQRLWKIRSDDSSHLLRILKGAGKSQDSKQSRHLRHMQRYLAKLSRSKDSAVLLQPWSEEENVRAKRSIHVTASGNQDQPMNLAVLEVSEHRPGQTFDTGMMLSKPLLRWRLLSTGYSTRLPLQDQKRILRLAFRMWSEVIPLKFVEDMHSHINRVDIEIAFGRGKHLGCARVFDGAGGEIAHTRSFNIHIDDDENFKVGASKAAGIYLLSLVVHEIGHVLGLAHINRSQSVMYALYHDGVRSPGVELSREDRQMVQSVYGVCKGSFSTVFDWVRRKPNTGYRFNTFFFREDRYWMYENNKNRTRSGDPQYTASDWKGVPNDVDGYLHVWYRSHGIHYYKYDSANDSVYEGWPKLIQDDFGPKPGQSEAVPNDLDSVFFDKRDNNIYFFKDDMVYVFNPSEPEKSRGCCERIRRLQDEFPSAVDNNVPLRDRLDAVYYSYADKTQYFFKGEDVWRNRPYNPYDKCVTNSIEFMGKWYDVWKDICEV